MRLRIIGECADLAPDIIDLLNEAERLTRVNSQLTLVIAINYDARQEIADAVRALGERVAQGSPSLHDIDAGAIAAHLDTAGIPDPDLIIRTSGRQRLSNFLLWQAAYAEFVFLPILWSDFDKAAFVAAIAEYADRDRRFGRISPTGSKNKKPLSQWISAVIPCNHDCNWSRRLTGANDVRAAPQSGQSVSPDARYCDQARAVTLVRERVSRNFGMMLSAGGRAMIYLATQYTTDGAAE